MDVVRLREQLQADLRPAIAGRRTREVAAIRSLLAALANAEAVPGLSGAYRVVEGRADVPRRALTDADVAAVLASEVDERRSAIAQYEAGGRSTAHLVEELTILERYLPAEG